MLKKMTNREKILIVALAFIIVYYFAVQLPVSNMTETITSEQVTVDQELDEATDKVIRLTKMQAALNKYQSSESKKTYTPAYDNTNDIIIEMDTILGGTKNYTISFGEPAQDGNIVRREINLQFSADSMQNAMKKIKKIETSPNCYLVKDASVMDNTRISAAAQPCTVVLKLTSFEYVE